MNTLQMTQTALFQRITEEEMNKMHTCLRFRIQSFQKGESILRCGSMVTDMGMVLSGSVQIENTDLLGNKSILSVVEPGEVFAETYGCIPKQPLMVDVTAKEDCSILLISTSHLMNPCENACYSHTTLIKNLLSISARKNLILSNRIFDTSAKSIRGRIISYFSRMAKAQNSQEIIIPFDRQQLADYLCVDRSALSRELGTMRRDGLLDFDRSHHNRFLCRLDFES